MHLCLCVCVEEVFNWVFILCHFYNPFHLKPTFKHEGQENPPAETSFQLQNKYESFMSSQRNQIYFLLHIYTILNLTKKQYVLRRKKNVCLISLQIGSTHNVADKLANSNFPGLAPYFVHLPYSFFFCSNSVIVLCQK